MGKKEGGCFSFSRREASRACLFITLFPFSVSSASPWREVSGHRTLVTSSYVGQSPTDYPLYVAGANSELVVDSPLNFSSEATSAAWVENKGTLTLKGASLNNHAASNPVINVISGYLNMQNARITTHQQGSYGVAAKGDSVINIKNSEIGLAERVNYGVELKDSATLVADGLTVNINSPANAAGIALNSVDAKANITNSVFNLTDSKLSYAIQQNLGTLTAEGLTILATGQNGGIRIGDWGKPTVTKISHSTIQAENEYALLIRNSSAELNDVHVIITGQFFRAMDINQNASVTVNGGSYATYGEYADAVWLPNEKTQLAINQASLTSFGHYSHALNVLDGTAQAQAVKLTTSGLNSYGIYSQNVVTGDGLFIKTTGDNSIGVASNAGGQIKLTASEIATYGTSAFGISAGSQSGVTASQVKVDTQGDNASALYTRAGSLAIDNSTLTSAGNAPAMWVNGGSAAQPAHVLLDNVTLTSAKQEAIRATGGWLNLELKNGAWLQGGNQQLLNALTVNGTTGAAVSHLEIEADNHVQLNGNVTVDTGSYASLALRDYSQLTGAVNNADIGVYTNSLWRITGSSKVRQLVNEGTVAFQGGAVNDALTVEGDYAGNQGTIIFNTELNGDRSATNRLIVKGDTSGSTWVEVLNAGGIGTKTIEGIQLVQVAGASNGEFLQKGRIVAGAYEYQLGRGTGKDDKNWYLVNWASSPAPAPAPPLRAAALRPEAGGYIANSAAAATLFNLTLHDRLGSRSQTLDDKETRSSLWLRQQGGHNRAYMGGELEAQSNRYSVQLGGDIAQIALDSGRLHLGTMAGYGRQATHIRSAQTHLTTESAISGYSLGAYATWLAGSSQENGLWLDSWLQYNWFNSSVAGEALWRENYHTQGISASLETGYDWKAYERVGNNQLIYRFYLQPHAQFIFNGLKTVRLTEQNGTRVVANKNSNLISRIGLRGWITESKQPNRRSLEPYVELNWLYNSDPYRVDLNHVDVEQNSGRNLAEIKTGVAGNITERFQLNGSVALQQGRYHYQDASLTLSGKYSF